jgi:hypothetical protein
MLVFARCKVRYPACIIDAKADDRIRYRLEDTLEAIYLCIALDMPLTRDISTKYHS